MRKASKNPGDRDWFTTPVEDLMRAAIRRVLKQWPKYKDYGDDLLDTLWATFEVSLPDDLRKALPFSTLTDEIGIKFRQYLKVSLDHCIIKLKNQAYPREFLLGDLFEEEIPIEDPRPILIEPNNATRSIKENKFNRELRKYIFKKLGRRAIPFLRWATESGRPVDAARFGLSRSTLYRDLRHLRVACGHLGRRLARNDMPLTPETVDFTLNDLPNEKKCYDFLLRLLHPQGLTCPNGHPLDAARVHTRDRAPILNYFCKICDSYFNLFTGTPLQGTKHRCGQVVRILQGIVRRVSTSQLAREIGIDRKGLSLFRHRLQG